MIILIRIIVCSGTFFILPMFKEIVGKIPIYLYYPIGLLLMIMYVWIVSKKIPFIYLIPRVAIEHLIIPLFLVGGSGFYYHFSSHKSNPNTYENIDYIIFHQMLIGLLALYTHLKLKGE